MGVLVGHSGAIAGSLTGRGLTYIGSATSTANTTTHTFSNQNIGGPGLIAVVVAGKDASTRTISSVSIGGNTASLAVKIDGQVKQIGIYYLRVNSGTTANISVSFSSITETCTISVYRVVDNSSDTPYATNSAGATTAASLTLNIPAGGVTIAGVSAGDSTVTASWVGLSEDYDAAYGSGRIATASGTMMAAETGRTITATMSSTSGPRLVAASWA